MDSFPNVHKILIIRLRYSGDVLLTLPAIRAVKQRFPDSKISYLANVSTASVLENNPLVDEIIEYAYRHKLSFLNNLRKRRFDMAIDLAGYDRSAITCWATRAPYRISANRLDEGFCGKKYCYTHVAKPPDPMKHKVEQYMEVVQYFGMTTSDLSLPIYLSPEEHDFVRQLFRRENISEKEIVIHCHPVARFAEKLWHFDRMAQSIDYLQNQPGCRVIITGSSTKQDLQQIREIRKHLQTQPVFLVGETTVRQVAALSARADLFFGLDSGIMHIAASMGTPVVALFGSSSVIHWRPWGEGHTVISDQPLDKPYQHPQPTPSGFNPFLDKLQVKDVVDVLDQKLHGLRK